LVGDKDKPYLPRSQILARLLPELLNVGSEENARLTADMAQVSTCPHRCHCGTRMVVMRAWGGGFATRGE
jgi:hypothetical protein